MSFLADIHSYWGSNATLTSAIPAAKVYTGLIPEGTAFPYAVITPIGLVPSPTTASGYYASFNFQISVFHSNPDTVESLCNTIVGEFDYQPISATTISCERGNGPVLFVDADTAARVYHGLIEYTLIQNRTLPNT